MLYIIVAIFYKLYLLKWLMTSSRYMLDFFLIQSYQKECVWTKLTKIIFYFLLSTYLLWPVKFLRFNLSLIPLCGYYDYFQLFMALVYNDLSPFLCVTLILFLCTCSFVHPYPSSCFWSWWIYINSVGITSESIIIQILPELIYESSSKIIHFT